MANEELLRLLKEGGVEEWNKWRMKFPFVKVNLSEADLSSADLRYVNLSSADLSDANLHSADLSSANLRNANLSDANLHSANLHSADLSNANLSNADLSNAYLSNADLSNADLSNANLLYADLLNVDLLNADLSNANLRNADLSNARLSNAKLSNARLFNADLLNTDLSNADLSNTELHNAKFSYAKLSNTNLDAAIFKDMIISKVKLSAAKGLDKIRHWGPSAIDQGTLQLSEGQLPDIFLKGCGLSDWEITASKLHNPDLTPEEIVTLTYEVARLRDEIGIQLRRVFISYSRTDERIADFINKRLDKDGIRAWQDTHDATAGPTEEIVKRAIEQNRVFLLILSKSAFESDWVEHEVFIAREIEKRFKRNVICPIALDDSWKTSIWRSKLRHQVEKYNILDFSKWEDPEFFETQYAKLLKGLDVYYLGI